MFFERAAAHAACTGVVANQGLEGLVGPVRRFQADSLLPGHIPHREARCTAVEHALVDTNLGDRMRAVATPTPVMVVSRARSAANGVSVMSSCSCRAAMSSSRSSICRRYRRSITA